MSARLIAVGHGLLCLTGLLAGAWGGDLNTRPDGNAPKHGPITGPMCGIANFDNGDLHRRVLLRSAPLLLRRFHWRCCH